jgi:hypothetical protein
MTFGQPESRQGDPGGERDADGGEVDQRLPLGRGVARHTRLPQATRSHWQRRRAAVLIQFELNRDFLKRPLANSIHRNYLR